MIVLVSSTEFYSPQQVPQNQIRLSLIQCSRDKDFHKNYPVHKKQFVTATCRATFYPTCKQEVTCHSGMLPSVFQF